MASFNFPKKGCGSVAYTLIAAPATEPITLDEVKAWIRETTTDLDDIITPLIKAARQACEDYQNIDYLTQTWKLTLDYLPALPLELKNPPLQSVTSVKVYDINDQEYTIPLTDLFVDIDSKPGRIAFKYNKSFPSISPRSVNCFECVFVTGNTEASKVSETVKLAMRYYISTAIDNPDGIQTEEFLRTFHQVLSAERRVPV